jgi:hypothetical protein
MNFCCHDDFTKTGSFTIDDISILVSYQSWLDTGTPAGPNYDENNSELENFKDWRQREVELKKLPPLVSELKYLPKTESNSGYDCANYTETSLGNSLTEINIDDLTYYMAFQRWNDLEKPDRADGKIYEGDGEFGRFLFWFEFEQSLNRIPQTTSKLMHLPSLESEWYIKHRTGNIAKGGDGLETSVDLEPATQGDLVVTFDATATVHPDANYDTQRIKAVELVFDNIEFSTDENGNTGLTVDKQNLINEEFKDTLGKPTLNYYYDYSIRTNGSEPRKNRSVIGFIDTTEGGDGEEKSKLGIIVFRVKADRWKKIQEISNDIEVADIRVYDETEKVERYHIVTCSTEEVEG